MAQLLTRDRDGDGRIDQWGAAFDRRPSFWVAWNLGWGRRRVVVPAAAAPRVPRCLRHRRGHPLVRGLGDALGDRPRPHDPTPRRSRSPVVHGRRIAFMTVGHDAVARSSISGRGGPLAVGFAPVPHRAGVPPATLLYATGYAVPAGMLRRKAGVELAADLTDSVPECGARLTLVSSCRPWPWPRKTWRRPTRRVGRRRFCAPPRTAARGGERASVSVVRWRPNSPT